MKNIVILGASPKPERYSYRAQEMLMEAGYRVFPVSPTGAEILGIPGYRSIGDIVADTESIHTLTLYIRAEHLAPLVDDILALAPERLIFNPGTEDEGLIALFKERGIEAVKACTLVLLQTGQFLESGSS